MPETRLTVGAAGWSCRLILDSAIPVSPFQLSGFSTEDGLAAESQIRAVLRGNIPEIDWVHAQAGADLSAFFGSPEAKRFTPLSPPVSRRSTASTLYTDSVLPDGPALELYGGRLRILNPERWPLYLEMVMTWLMLRESSLVSLHAAVCAVGNCALVLLGPSGSGKSTLAFAIAAQGGDFYDDESAFIDRQDGRLYLRSRRLTLRPGGWHLLGSPPPGRWYEAKPGDPKYSACLPPTTRPCPQEHALLFFLDGFGQSALTPMRGSEAALRLARGMGHGDPSFSARLEAAAEIVTRCPSRRLTVGMPGETARMLLSFAEEVA